MVIDIIEELMGPGHGPQTGVSVVDSKDEVERTLKVGCKESWNLPFVQVLDLLENRFRRTGMGLRDGKRSGSVISTPYRVHFAHAIFSRMWLKTFLHSVPCVM